MLTLSDLVSKYPNFLLEIAQICYETFLSYESFCHFFVRVVYRHYSLRNNCLENAQKFYSGVFLFRKFQTSRLQLIIVPLSKPFRIAAFGNLRVEGGSNGYHLMPQPWPCIPRKCLVVINLVYNIDVKLWNCDHAKLNSPHLRLFPKLTQHWWNIEVEKTLWIWRRGLNFAATLSINHS